MSDANLHAEIETLRREIAALLADRKAKIDPELAAMENAVETATRDLSDQLRTLAREISEFAEDPEQAVINHPLTSVLGALVLGILIGRLIHR